MKKYLCEAIGTAVLVLFGCGTAVVTGNIVAISLAFGLSIVAMAYVIGNISGCHVIINKKITMKEFLFYVIAQVVGAFVGAGILYFVLNSCQAVSQAGGISVVGLGANGFGDGSTLGVNMIAALVVEVILTFVFIYTILGVTSDDKKSSVAGIVIGLTLTFVHLIGINLTGTSVNPARSLAPATIMAIVGDTKAISQVWVFIVAPFVGSVLAAFAYKFLNKETK